VIGPILQGLARPVQIVPLDAPSSTIVLMAGLAAYQSLAR
jgi:phosphotransacetylase